VNEATRERLVLLRGQLASAGKALQGLKGFNLLFRHLTGAVKAIDGLLRQ
jgi:hypothetical protein